MYPWSCLSFTGSHSTPSSESTTRSSWSSRRGTVSYEAFCNFFYGWRKPSTQCGLSSYLLLCLLMHTLCRAQANHQFPMLGQQCKSAFRPGEGREVRLLKPYSYPLPTLVMRESRWSFCRYAWGGLLPSKKGKYCRAATGGIPIKPQWRSLIAQVGKRREYGLKNLRYFTSLPRSFF